VISGTPTTAGTAAVTLGATNAGGTGSAQLTIVVLPAAPVIAPTASGVVGLPFSYQIAGSGNPTSFGASGLPAGLSVDPASGLITGTPAAAGTTVVTITATNAGGTGTVSLTITIAPLAGDGG
jgi:PKD repeat protein